MLGQQTDRLAAIEQDLRSRSVPLADILRACRSLAKEAQAVHLEEWATAELEGYWPLASVPDYRRVSAPIVSTFDVPHRGLVMEFFNLQMVPERFRELLGQPVPLNQSVDELEAVAAQYEARDVPVQLEVIASDLLVVMWNKNNPQGRRLLTMTWAIDPPLIRGVLGRVRTKLTEFIAELRTVIGQSGRLPSAEQADAALRTVLPSAIFNNSNVTVVTAYTKNGDIMPGGPRTTIKGNKTKISDSTGNISVASAHVAQMNNDEIDIEKVHRFAGFAVQIAPTLGLNTEQHVELQAAVDELQAAADDPARDKGRFRKVIGRVLKSLGAAGATEAQKIAVQMGDDLIRELGGEIIRDLSH